MVSGNDKNEKGVECKNVEQFADLIHVMLKPVWTKNMNSKEVKYLMSNRVSRKDVICELFVG